ncbi:MAG: ribosomal protein S18-alanine N-acetyltransferase [Chloroflexi bacterium]|nr:ribosomal protein S18-alanine N-acetyltransferase [Chloroflexota bacterium]
MVAHPGLRLRVLPMHVDDLDAVHAIEKQSFRTPWPPHAYRSELESNDLAHYVCAWLGGRIVAYAGMWIVVDEAHITTFAVDPAWRRRGIGDRLLMALLDLAIARGARDATLEVRVSNVAARRLYENFGFRPIGIRPRYYTDDGEDALVMTTPPFTDGAMADRLDRLRAWVATLPEPGEAPRAGGPVTAEGNGR